jgi:hypothetical protein
MVLGEPLLRTENALALKRRVHGGELTRGFSFRTCPTGRGTSSMAALRWASEALPTSSRASVARPCALPPPGRGYRAPQVGQQVSRWRASGPRPG